jgi:hypothetical protein
LLLFGAKPGLSLDSDTGAAMVDVLNLPDRFGQWQKAIMLLSLKA